MKIVLASNNKGKIREFNAIFSEQNIEIIPQADLGVSEIPETGLTFVENALIKARHASNCTGLPAISDDSGIMVSALNDAPSIYSARFAGENASSADNIDKLLHLLEGVKDRQARFYCVLVYVSHALDPAPVIAEGVWHGEIMTEKRGNDGFGYDPIFFDKNENCSAAELDPHKKNLMSHRGLALKCLLEKLKDKLG